MRLDKYLKVSRIIKRRTVAKEVSDAGKITVNGRPAKASTDVKVGDKLVLTFGGKELEVEILQEVVILLEVLCKYKILWNKK